MVVSAEPPSRFGRQKFARQEAAPYSPSGWKPAGQEFRLPARQMVPQTVYGPPSPSYGPPPEYGPPSPSYGTPTEEGTTTETDAESVTTESSVTNENEESKRLTKANGKKSEKFQEENGIYYIYHPNGYLQKVVFSRKNDIQNMIYKARIQYQDVEPIRDPIYTYDPQTLSFKEIQS